MPVFVTNNGGDFGLPGIGCSRKGETHEVPMEVGTWLQKYPEFQIRLEDGDEFRFRDEAGRPKYVGYYGPVDSRFGYGGGGILILRALTHLGIEVAVNPRYNADGHLAYTTDLHPDAASQVQPRRYFPRYELAHCLPDSYHYGKGAPRRIGWTMWESDRIPDGSRYSRKAPFGDWASLINEHTEQLIVPCQHNKELFEACGVKVPVTVIPYGLDTDIWPFHEREERDTFTVVLYGDLTERKGPFEAVVAFQRAFPKERNVRLILKTQYGHLGRGHMPLIRDDRIVVINETWSRSQLIRLLHDADCFLWPSKGEGFGLPPLQAMLTGLPVVMTTHTGMAEYYDPKYFYEIRTAGMQEAPLYGRWYVPDVDHAAEQLRYVYEHRKEVLRKAKAGAAYVRKKFSMTQFAKRLSEFLDTLN